ncbi:DUF742 domain-containing protein [Actinacidiphila acidipaludis]|uniref:DUF742 domain-containing protein n=1 Tax=Actinacidiphila acidipaludis TaxID=2873382 RepID=A0ABS7QCJ3_9ACTN|nr:DUF742 domain-containing protein [Streptomyces acidipaludis]MBY8880871.1 DUF742 domain-containing protein [Streptomyces acidipaludis]
MDDGSDLELTNSLVPYYVRAGGAALPPEEEFDRTSWVAITPEGLHARIVDRDAANIRDLLGSGPLSVHEVAARIGVPLGVCRVLLAQLRDDGLLVSRPPIPKAEAPDRELLDRVRAGLIAHLRIGA